MERGGELRKEVVGQKPTVRVARRRTLRWTRTGRKAPMGTAQGFRPDRDTSTIRRNSSDGKSREIQKRLKLGRHGGPATGPHGEKMTRDLGGEGGIDRKEGGWSH